MLPKLHLYFILKLGALAWRDTPIMLSSHFMDARKEERYG